jgi:hypothetical protein
LKDAGLVTDQREERWVYYGLNPEAITSLEEVLATMRSRPSGIRIGDPMPTLIFGTLGQVDRERRRILVGSTELPVPAEIPLERFRAGTPITVVTDVRGGEELVTAIEIDPPAASGPGEPDRRPRPDPGGDAG